MIKFNLVSLKENHTLYENIKKGCSTFCKQSEDCDVYIVGLDCHITHQTFPSIMHNVISSGKPYFLYMEHSNCVVDPEISYVNDTNFKGFITHLVETQAILRSKYPNVITFYIPVGVEKQNSDKVKSVIDLVLTKPEITLLFWGSWNDIYNNNYIGRGGDKVNTLCNNLMQRHENVRLIAKSQNHMSCSRYNRSMITRDYISYEQLCNFHWDADILLLPSMQVHAVSIPFANSFGLPVLGNYNFGMSDFLIDGYNSIVYKDDSDYIENATNALSNLILDRSKLKSLRSGAVETSMKHNLHNYDLFFYIIFMTTL
jgi:glycosyltransferase involved in cell wall biosynthesis